MTRKDFELIADVLRDCREAYLDSGADPHSIDTVAECFAIRLPATNPRFNRERFLTACGLEEA
jgi:hypothetical protein